MAREIFFVLSFMGMINVAIAPFIGGWLRPDGYPGLGEAAAIIGLSLMAISLGLITVSRYPTEDLRIAGTVGALGCVVGAWGFWRSGRIGLAITCGAAILVLLAWGWGLAWWQDRRAGRRSVSP